MINKKLLLFSVVFVAMMMSLSGWAQKEAVIKFQLRNYHASDTLTLSWGAINKSMSPLIATLTPKADEEITIPLNEPRLLQLALKGQTDYLEILASPGEYITVSGRMRGSSSLKNQLDKLKVTGSAHQERYSDIVDGYNEFADSIENAIKNEYADVIQLMSRSKAGKNEQAIADMYETQHGKRYVERVTSSFAEKKEMLERVILGEKDNFMGPLLMLRLAGRLDKSYRKIYDQLDENSKQSYYGREVKDEVYPPSMIGDLAPTVSVGNEAGETKLLSFVHHGNKYLLLDFWASWCEPCRKEIPTLKKLYEAYHVKGLDIIAISADHNREDWKQALAELKEPWCNYIDLNRQSISEYKVEYIPNIFIINNEGTIIAEKLRGKELEDYVDKLFKE